MGREEILKYVLPVFLPDTELQEDNIMYDTEPEKLAVYEWKKLLVCFQSSREPKLYRNSDLEYYKIEKKIMLDVAIKNMETKYESYIEPFYNDSDFGEYLNKNEMRKNGGYDPDNLYCMGVDLFPLSGAEAILSEVYLNKTAEKFGEDFYVFVDSVNNMEIIPCSAVYSSNALSTLSEIRRLAVDESFSFFHGIFRYYVAERKLRLISRIK